MESLPLENENNPTTNINPIIKADILSTLNTFINEIELVFDYVDRKCVENLKHFLTKLNDDVDMIEFSQASYKCLKQYETNLSYVTKKQKLKTIDFNFLDEIILFNNLLDFKVFNKENKNTKRTIVTYLYNLYMSCFILQFGTQTDNNELTQNILGFVENLQKSSQQLEKQELEKSRKNKISNKKNLKVSKPANANNNDIGIMNIFENLTSGGGLGGLGGALGGLGGGLGGLDTMFQSLMSNNEIMNIAKDLSKDIQDQNIDPMTLLSSMMSGKPDTQIKNLVNNVTEKLEQKLTNGEIDKTVLEIQAQNILNNFNVPKESNK